MDFIILTPLFVALAGFAYYLFQDARNQRENRLDRQTARYNQLRRYNPDGLGNYPAFYDPETNNLIQIDPGNARHFAPAPPPTYPAPRAQPITRPLVINYPNRPALGAQEPPLELNEPEPFTVQALLSEAKQKGDNKSDAIKSICGVSRGGSKAYKEWSDIWETL